MKKLLLLLLIALPTIILAQDTIKIPAKAAKQMAIDLLVCDSTKAELEYVQKELNLTMGRVAIKDTQLMDARIRLANLKDQYNAQKSLADGYQKLYGDVNQQYSALVVDNKRRKVKRTAIDIIGVAFIGTLIYLSIIR